MVAFFGWPQMYGVYILLLKAVPGGLLRSGRESLFYVIYLSYRPVCRVLSR
jgi:hypothetical protein